MNHPVRWSLLSTLAITVTVVWLTHLAAPPQAVAGPLPSRPTEAALAPSGSLYPAPQVDPSAPPAPAAPTF
jgi:hypothetical protein